MASEQELPLQKKENNEWSTRRLFPFADVTKTFAKTFTSVFEVLLGLAVLTIGVSEILNREVSWLFYILTVLLTFVSFIERRATPQDKPKDSKK